MLEIQDVWQEFLIGGSMRPALRGINLQISKGERVAIMGPNGAGKSSLGAVIVTGTPSKGHILLEGRDISTFRASEKARVCARLTQNPAESLSDALSVAEHFALAISRGRRRSFWRGVSSSVRDEAQVRLSTLRPGMVERIGDGIVGFSGGERQLVALALLTVAPPSVLVLDEPTSALDVEGQLAVQKAALEMIRSLEMTVVWITHDPDEALRVASRLLLMAEGKVVHDISQDALARTTRGELADILSALILGAGPPERVKATPSESSDGERVTAGFIKENIE